MVVRWKSVAPRHVTKTAPEVLLSMMRIPYSGSDVPQDLCKWSSATDKKKKINFWLEWTYSTPRFNLVFLSCIPASKSYEVLWIVITVASIRKSHETDCQIAGKTVDVTLSSLLVCLKKMKRREIQQVHCFSISTECSRIITLKSTCHSSLCKFQQSRFKLLSNNALWRWDDSPWLL